MDILVTGAAGQVGADFLPLLVERGHAVRVFDLAPRPADCPPPVAWTRGDVTCAAEVADAVREAPPAILFHLAAILSAHGERVPHRTWCVNLEGTRNVLEAARLFGVGQVFFSSTIAAFGPGLPDPVGDDAPMRPTTMYGVTKVAGELLGEYYERAFGLDFRGVRFPGLLNAQVPGGGTTDYALWMFLEGLRSGVYEAFVRPDSRVPLMYAPDALRAMLELAEAPKERLTRCVYNVAAIHPTAEEIAAAARRRIPGVRIGFRPDPVRQRILDSWPRRLDDAAARRDWGWSHAYDLDAMVDDMLPRMRALLEARNDFPVHA